MGRLIDRLIALVYPGRCPLCQKIADGFCDQCRPKIRKIHAPYCFSCGKQLELDGEYCMDCQRTNHRFVRGRAVLQYKGREKEAIHKIKYENKREYLDTFADLMDRELKTEIRRWNIDVCVPIPMYRKKERKRGFNPSYLLAKKLADKWEIPLAPQLLIKVSDTGEQKKLSAKERRRNLQKAFFAEECSGLTILLVDDVYTTGSTMDAACEVLREAGAKAVYFVCICAGNGNN